MNEPVYLGDGLYYEYDGFQVRLFAHDGISAYNEVFLGPEVLKVLIETLKKEKLITP